MSLKKLDLSALLPAWSLILLLALQNGGMVQSAYCPVRLPEQVLLIDAGHGGEDGGAVALSGTPESEINLAVALKLDGLCALHGVRSQLMREGDCSIADKDALTIREKKRSDLQRRTAIANETVGAVLLSVHQNHFSDQKSHGAQVFCHDDEISAAWGQETQMLLRQAIDPDNDRASKTISKEVYLMNHVNCPALLVECGFLSNPEENALLESDEYQTQLAAVLLTSYMNYFT